MQPALSQDWPGFRGPSGTGLVEVEIPVATSWDATDPNDASILWSVTVPGLGHCSPVVYEDKLFLATAISADGPAPLKVGQGGQPTAADDNGEQRWVVLCYSKITGEELWRTVALKGVPKATRHAKATHANTTLAVNSENILACFGSEGFYCFDHQGRLKWQKDIGIVDVSKYGIGWGYASSPVLFENRVVLVCDDPEHPFVACYDILDGSEIWKISRSGICERSWGSALVCRSAIGNQVVVNGWPWIVSYDLETGDELWRIAGGGDNPVPTPFVANEKIYITNAHGGQAPIYVLKKDAEGNLSESEQAADKALIWKSDRGGAYMSTPIVYKGLLYLGNTNGLARCFDAESGEAIYEKRLGRNAAIYASLVATDGKVFFTSEDGYVYVVRSGTEFDVIAKNPLGAPCFATPAISEGVLYFRTQEKLIAVGPGAATVHKQSP